MLSFIRPLFLFSLLLLAAASPAIGQANCPLGQANCRQMSPGDSTEVLESDGVLRVESAESLLPVGENEFEPIFANMIDANGDEIPNSLPSLPGLKRPDFNLLAEPITSRRISRASPTTDLEKAIDRTARAAARGRIARRTIQRAIDILEGNPIKRVYSGLPVLHYQEPQKVKTVEPIKDAAGNVIGGNVNVHQIWFDQRIESDTALLDPAEVMEVPWTVTYTVDVLKGGQDDFSPFATYFDVPKNNNPQRPDVCEAEPDPEHARDYVHGPPYFGIDQVFAAMKQGRRYTIKVKNPPGKYFNLIYTWGWRKHPPRIQVMDNALKPIVDPSKHNPGEPGCITTTAAIAREVFGDQSDLPLSEDAKLSAIAQIGELAPAKRMWEAFREARGARSAEEVEEAMERAAEAFDDWSDRTRLPSGIESDQESDHTVLYVNNTMYGDIRKFSSWKRRGAKFRVTALNGDNFDHGYSTVDFGGQRGWENQFEDSGGPGGSHTFGRAQWSVVAGKRAKAGSEASLPLHGTIAVPPVNADGTPGKQVIEHILNFEPSDRLRLYQYDPLHHDVAIYSLH